MDNWRESVMADVEQAKDGVKVFAVIAENAGRLGFEYCAFGMRMPIPLSRMPVYMQNNYPVQWQRLYQENGYLRIDPTVTRGLGSTLPFLWPAPAPHASEFWDAAWSHGLKHGWAQSARDPSGAIGMFTFARSHTSIDRFELDTNESRLEWLAHIGHAAMAKILLPDTLPEVRHNLSLREREVLLWSAEGKTALEIGDILGLTESTVNYHVTNAVKKLRASNKIHAVAKAAILGILFAEITLGNGFGYDPSISREDPQPASNNSRPNETTAKPDTLARS